MTSGLLKRGGFSSGWSFNKGSFVLLGKGATEPFGTILSEEQTGVSSSVCADLFKPVGSIPDLSLFYASTIS